MATNDENGRGPMDGLGSDESPSVSPSVASTSDESNTYDMGAASRGHSPDPADVPSPIIETSTDGSPATPLVLPSKTRLKIRVKRLQVAAEWRWNEGGDDTCGICRMPFEACCVDCKAPGDDCPLVLGVCKHPFHVHCIDKWTDTQNAQRPQCPLCRQEWKFAT